MMHHHAGCTRSLHPSTVRRRRRRKRKSRAVSIPEAAHGLAEFIPLAIPPPRRSYPVAQMLLQTRAAIVDNTVTLMTAAGDYSDRSMAPSKRSHDSDDSDYASSKHRSSAQIFIF